MPQVRYIMPRNVDGSRLSLEKRVGQKWRLFTMIESTVGVLEEENSARIDLFVQNQVDGLLKRTRTQAEVDVQQASPEQDEDTDVNAT